MPRNTRDPDRERENAHLKDAIAPLAMAQEHPAEPQPAPPATPIRPVLERPAEPPPLARVPRVAPEPTVRGPILTFLINRTRGALPPASESPEPRRARAPHVAAREPIF